MNGYDKVYGRNAVRELIRSGRNVNKLFITENHDSGLVNIINQAKKAGIFIQTTNKKKLDSLIGNTNHQGVVAICSPVSYVSVDDILKTAEQKGEKPFIVILDNITDPHNAGAIVRTAYCAGCHGIIQSKRRGCGIGEGMYKSSAGAVEYLPMAMVSNIAQTIDSLKEKGIFIVGSDMKGEDYTLIDYDMPLAIVIGAEGEGMSRLVKEKCDFLSCIPIKNNFDSLNASVAAGIIIYEALKQRG